MNKLTNKFELMDELKLQKEYTKKLWQIQRFHDMELKIKLYLSPSFGIPTWNIEIIINGERHLTDGGANLWKRLKKGATYLEKYYGENCYKYGKGKDE